MKSPDRILDVVCKILTYTNNGRSCSSLAVFDDCIAAISADSGLSKLDVQSRLVDRMLEGPRRLNTCTNLIFMGDYLHLRQVN